MGSEVTSQERRTQEGEMRACEEDVGFDVEVVDRGILCEPAASLRALFCMV